MLSYELNTPRRRRRRAAAMMTLTMAAAAATTSTAAAAGQGSYNTYLVHSRLDEWASLAMLSGVMTSRVTFKRCTSCGGLKGIYTKKCYLVIYFDEMEKIMGLKISIYI